MMTHARLVVVITAFATGCRLGDDTWDFHTTGFARVMGEVRQADGAPFAGALVSLSCGTEQPGGFLNGPVAADAAGAYRLDAGAPDGFAPPPNVADVTLVCRLAAAAPTLEQIADSLVAVRFGRDRAAAPTTTVDLRAR